MTARPYTMGEVECMAQENTIVRRLRATVEALESERRGREVAEFRAKNLEQVGNVAGDCGCRSREALWDILRVLGEAGINWGPCAPS